MTEGKGFKSAKNRVKVKGKVIDGEHEQYALTYGMMLGISVSVRIGAKRDASHPDQLRLSDFQDKIALDFPPEGSTLTQAHDLNHSFHFKDYAPRAFSRIRKCFGVSSASYAASLCGDLSFIEFCSNSRSGQFFFFSQDGKYMIKTQTKEECKFLLRILPRYYRHVKNHPHTLVTRFLGMHRVEMGHIRRKVRFIIMGSVFATEETLHTTFDLKGSTAGRFAKKGEKVFKDEDILGSKALKLRLGPERKAVFMDQVRKDVEFLAALEVMDYSLLLGVAGGEGHEPITHVGRDRAASLARESVAEVDENAEGDADDDDDDAPITAEEADAMDRCIERSSTSKEDDGTNPEDGDVDDSASAAAAADEGAEDDPSEGLSKTNKRRVPPAPPLALYRGDGNASRLGGHTLTPAAAAARASPAGSSRKRLQKARASTCASRRPTSRPPRRALLCRADGSCPTDMTVRLAPRRRRRRRPRSLEPTHSSARRCTPAGGIVSEDESGVAQELYFTGIIDFLQQYNARKHMETGVHMLKWAIGGRNYLEASCVDPVSYSKRFVGFMDRIST